MVVSYTKNYGYTDAYANKNINNLTTNGDGGGNGGGGAFFKMFEEQETEESKKALDKDKDLVDDIMNMSNGYYPNNNIIRDYIDNSLLLNTEQVACTNITQHIALKSNVRETLKFLNLQAAKSMVNSKKRNYTYQSTPKQYTTIPKQNTIENKAVSQTNNFFEAKLNNPAQNFFIQ
ncbi:MAG: hypothetical protein NC200_02245 [Candidatus Gastranaerophilales bacterium]|nr:hypothetical protein [Candidatus Gastranaerophilales bacterium]